VVMMEGKLIFWAKKKSPEKFQTTF